MLRNARQLFKYKIDRVVLLYYHRSPLYDRMAEALAEHNIDFIMRRYEEVKLDAENLSALRGGPDTTLIVCDDATSLVDGNKNFNHLIHVVRHSGLLFVLLIHGPIFTRPSSRAMVNAVRYMIFTVSNRARQMVQRFAQMHANKTTVSRGRACDLIYLPIYHVPICRQCTRSTASCARASTTI